MIDPQDLAKSVHRVKFRKWTELEDLRDRIIRAADEGANEFPDKFIAYLSAALDIEKEKAETLSWMDCVLLFYAIFDANLPPSYLPLTDAPISEQKSPKVAWDYPGRIWFLYAHILSKEYGWNLEYIGELEIDTALSLIQEILTQEQLDKEFLWGMSEIAYPYSEATKKNKFQPLTRPYWMLPTAEPIKKFRIPKSMLPQGIVIDMLGAPHNAEQ